MKAAAAHQHKPETRFKFHDLQAACFLFFNERKRNEGEKHFGLLIVRDERVTVNLSQTGRISQMEFLTLVVERTSAVGILRAAHCAVLGYSQTVHQEYGIVICNRPRNEFITLGGRTACDFEPVLDGW